MTPDRSNYATAAMNKEIFKYWFCHDKTKWLTICIHVHLPFALQTVCHFNRMNDARSHEKMLSLYTHYTLNERTIFSKTNVLLSTYEYEYNSSRYVGERCHVTSTNMFTPINIIKYRCGL